MTTEEEIKFVNFAVNKFYNSDTCIEKMAKKIGYEKEDLVQECYIGLMRAKEKYKNTKELQKFKFSTIAFHNIKGDFYKIIRRCYATKRKGDMMTERIEDYKKSIENVETDIFIKDKISRLDPKYQDYIEKRTSGYSNLELAKIYNCSRQTIVKGFSEIRKQINKEFIRDDE